MNSRKRNTRHVRERPLRWLTVAVAVAVAVGGYLFVTRSQDTPVRTHDTATGVEHVHGLGIDPADGVLYAATHTGLFRVPDQGEATRVGDRFQDTMGFTVVGPNHFLGSGHPDVNDRELRQPGLPPLLGLIESTDAGETWKPLSLLGEADFHTLVAAHERVYGFDATSQRFMVSRDKKTWETRSEVGLVSFAVDPRHPDKVIATTGDGLIRSSDGGQTWQPTDGPAVVFLDWDPATGAWGLGPAGDLFNNASGLESGEWRRQAELDGRAEAVLVAGSEIYAAVLNQGATEIRRSTDGGTTWTVRYRDS